MQSHVRYAVGGSELQVDILSRSLAERGLDVSYINGDYGQPDLETIEGVRIYRAKTRWREGNPVMLPLRFLISKYHLFRLMRRIDADIYHQRCGGTLTFYTALFKRTRNKKMVFTSASMEDCRRRNPMYLWALKNSDAVITLTEDMRHEMKRNLGIDSVVIPSGHPVPPEVKHNRNRTVIWIGKHDNIKRPWLFVELAKRLSDTDLKFILIGSIVNGGIYENISGYCKCRSYPGDQLLGHTVGCYHKSHIGCSRRKGFQGNCSGDM